MRNKVIKNAILYLDENVLKPEMVSNLFKIVPTNAEQNQYKELDKDPKFNPSIIDPPDKFCYELRLFHNIIDRMELWKFKMEFNELLNDEKKKLSIITKCHDIIKESNSFKTFLKYILYIGNYMNYGNRQKGNAHGFTLTTLERLHTTKSQNKSLSILELIIINIRKTGNYNALTFVKEFYELDILDKTIELIERERIEKKKDKNHTEPETDEEKAARLAIPPDMRIKNSMNEISEYLDKLNEHISIVREQKDDNEQNKLDKFVEIMQDFYDDAKSQFDFLDKQVESQLKDLDKLGQYYGQKKDADCKYIILLRKFSEEVYNVEKEIIVKEKIELKNKKKELMENKSNTTKVKSPKKKPKIIESKTPKKPKSKTESLQDKYAKMNNNNSNSNNNSEKKRPLKKRKSLAKKLLSKTKLDEITQIEHKNEKELNNVNFEIQKNKRKSIVVSSTDNIDKDNDINKTINKKVYEFEALYKKPDDKGKENGKKYKHHFKDRIIHLDVTNKKIDIIDIDKNKKKYEIILTEKSWFKIVNKKIDKKTKKKQPCIELFNDNLSYILYLKNSTTHQKFVNVLKLCSKLKKKRNKR